MGNSHGDSGVAERPSVDRPRRRRHGRRDRAGARILIGELQRPDGRSQEAYEAAERAFALPMLVLSVVFIPVVVTPIVMEVSPATSQALDTVSWAIWAAFAFEYIVLLYLAPDRGRMVRTHIPDLLIILLPFLRPLRALRGLRLLRPLVGLARAAVGVRQIATRPGFRGFLLVVIGVMTAGAGLTYAFERNVPEANITSFGDALWWAVVTATTVGYGDRFPVSPEGRGIALLLMLVGISLLSVVTANIAAFFVERSVASEETDINARLERIEQLLLERHGGVAAERTGRGPGTAVTNQPTSPR